MTRPELIGHRGAPRAHRENTLASFLHAIDGGADAIELDVHGTADGTIVVHHDATIGRAGTDGSPQKIATLTADELRRLAPTIPTLGEVLDAAALRAIVYVEIKGAEIESAVIDCIHKSSAVCAVHSFDHRVARTVANAAPDVPTGILLSSYLLDPTRALESAGARDYWVWWEFADRALVDTIHAVGGRVVAWTVNDAAVARELARIGVDGICSDIASEFATLPGFLG